MLRKQRESGATGRPPPTWPDLPNVAVVEVEVARPPLYTRYCAAPRPAHPVREPSFLHALLAAAWLGRVIDPLPHAGARHTATLRRG